MFCPKCGKSIADGAKFCPSCGKRLSARESSAAQPTIPHKPAVTEGFAGVGKGLFQEAKPASSMGKVKTERSFNWGWVLVAGDVLLILLTFAPWVSVNVVMYSMQYSLLDLTTMAFRFNDLSLSLLGSSSGAVTVISIVGCLVLILMVSLFAVDAYKRIKGKSFTVFAFIVSTIVSTIAVLGIYMIDRSIASESANYLGSSALTGTVTPTLWVWAFLVLSIACMVAYVSAEKLGK